MFYQNTKDEKTAIKNKTRKNWENTGKNIVLGVKTLVIILGHKK